MERIKRSYFIREPKIVAKDLIGNYLVRITKQGKMVGKIIETEAYLGPEDKASHSYNFKKTKRTETMYHEPGTFYVYLIYGMYHCLNVITEPKDIPSAVLIRKLYPVEGVDLMKERRDVKIGKNYKNLVDGPGKLCIAFDITKEKFNDKDSCGENSKLYFAYGKPIDKEIINVGKRIGIDYADEDKDLPLRFFLNN
jgi:DNA-3-methyladenine glycosylase